MSANYTLTPQQLKDLFIEATFHYYPSNTLAFVGASWFFLMTVIVFALTTKHKGSFMYIVAFTGALEVVGYDFRPFAAEQAPAILPYIITVLALLVGPIFLALVNYLVVAKLVRASGKSVPLPFCGRSLQHNQIARFFVCGDIICFFIFASAGGLLASQNASLISTGNSIMIASLVIQIAFFAVFTWITVTIHFHEEYGYKNNEKTQPIFRGLYSTIALLFIRNIYRFIEFVSAELGANNGGYITHNEWLFYVFETIPVALAFVAYCYYHFGRLLTAAAIADDAAVLPATAKAAAKAKTVTLSVNEKEPALELAVHVASMIEPAEKESLPFTRGPADQPSAATASLKVVPVVPQPHVQRPAELTVESLDEYSYEAVEIVQPAAVSASASVPVSVSSPVHNVNSNAPLSVAPVAQTVLPAYSAPIRV